MIKKLYILLFVFHASIILADDPIQNTVYLFYPGPNLVSFNTLPDDTDIQSIFSPVEENIISKKT